MLQEEEEDEKEDEGKGRKSKSGTSVTYSLHDTPHSGKEDEIGQRRSGHWLLHVDS